MPYKRNPQTLEDRQRAAEAAIPLSERRLTSDELAVVLKVPLSWVYKQTSQRGPDAMPHFKCGKYCRFDLQQVLEWSANKAQVAHK